MMLAMEMTIVMDTNGHKVEHDGHSHDGDHGHDEKHEEGHEHDGDHKDHDKH